MFRRTFQCDMCVFILKGTDCPSMLHRLRYTLAMRKIYLLLVLL